MRVELAKLLLSAPDVLLLDEPTNHLDLPSIAWFEETLQEYRGAALIVSHDRTFLRRHATRVAELENARFTIFEGGYDRFVTQKEERRLQLAADARSQGRRIAETERFIERFRYKASKARQVQSRVKSLAKLERVELAPESRRSMRLRIPAPARAGEVVLRLEGVHKRYGETVVYRGIDFLLRRGDRVALAGPNGAGKSTLLRIASGALAFDAGSRTLGHNATVGFYAQHQLETLDGSRSVLAELESAASVDDVPRLRGHLGAFLFSGDDVQKKVSVLSGGEKARLALAKMLLRPANFLVLDEPTNHLDVAACEVLEEALSDYQGTLLFISHDRAFINALATRVIEVRDGVLGDHTGNYDDFERSTRAVAAPEVAAQPEPEPAAPASKQERIAQRERGKEDAKRLARTRKRLAAVEAEIAQNESALEQLTWRLADPAVHRDGDAMRALDAERGELRGRVEALYLEWERLAAEIEAAQEA
jgi:ATP-binding cassette subfamily F protein 3